MSLARKRLGFIGLGKMGYPMAHLLHRADYALTVFDAAVGTSTRFVSEHPGAVRADNLAALSPVQGVITMLPDSDAVDSVVLGQANDLGLIDILSPGASVVDMSSSHPQRSRTLARKLQAQGLHFLDAPVSGGVKRACDGSLAIMVGGDLPLFHEYHDVFEQMGNAIIHVGGPGAGHALKALNNYVSAAGLVATVEALTIGQSFGLDSDLMVDVLNNSTGKNNTTEHKVKQFMLSGTFNSGFALQLMIKDLANALSLGELLGLNMRLGEQVLRVWSEASYELGDSADHTEMYRYLQQVEKKNNGTEFATP